MTAVARVARDARGFLGRTGGYAIQGRGATLVARIELTGYALVEAGTADFDHSLKNGGKS